MNQLYEDDLNKKINFPKDFVLFRLRFTVAEADVGKILSFCPPEISVTAVVVRCKASVPGLRVKTH